MDRRSFIKGSLSLFAAPAIVKAESIMPIWLPPEKKIIEHSWEVTAEAGMPAHHNVFPVGSLFQTPRPESPSELLGFGEWEKIYGRVITGVQHESLDAAARPIYAHINVWSRTK